MLYQNLQRGSWSMGQSHLKSGIIRWSSRSCWLVSSKFSSRHPSLESHLSYLLISFRFDSDILDEIALHSLIQWRSMSTIIWKINAWRYGWSSSCYRPLLHSSALRWNKVHGNHFVVDLALLRSPFLGIVQNLYDFWPYFCLMDATLHYNSFKIIFNNDSWYINIFYSFL